MVSRQIQYCCDTNTLFKALSSDTVLRFTTLASFVREIAEAIEAVFEQVLLVCPQQGLLGGELFAIAFVIPRYRLTSSHTNA
tara:strand:- start:1703 stop:1948 length:246 start_codon:yes stop_codon:yes gene_type:complete